MSASPRLPFSPLDAITATGSVTLLFTMGLVTLSAVGRHFGLPLPGTVEVVEVLILITAAAGILNATIAKSHAAARLIIDLFSERVKRWLEIVTLLLALVFCLGMVIGNSWLLIDVWNLSEASHLLGIPIIPFRIIFIITMSATCVMLATHLANRKLR